MDWHTIWSFADFLIFPVMIVLFFTGLFMLFSGLRQVNHGVYREQPVSWYNYPTVLTGIGIMLLALFFSLWLASQYISNSVIRILVLLSAIVCGGLSLLFGVGASRHSLFYHQDVDDSSIHK